MQDKTILAKITALENASEFIRSHGEEGGIDESTFEDFTLREYLRQCKVVANSLDRRIEKIKRDYNIIDK